MSERMSEPDKRKTPDVWPSIGVFDSGVGGLTVLSQLHQRMPFERTVYLGDTARVPYGTRSKEAVVRYAKNNTRTLLEESPLKAVVIACNTASAVALDVLQEILPVPVFGVIDPGASAAIEATKGGRIVVLGTKGTVRSRAYEKALRKQNFAGAISSIACPLWVPLVEEGWISGEIPERIAAEYLKDLPADTDTLVLGCTHYPLLRGLIAELAGRILQKDIAVVDGGAKVAAEVEKALQVRGESAVVLGAKHRYLLTDAPEQVLELAPSFLGEEVKEDSVELVNVLMQE